MNENLLGSCFTKSVEINHDVNITLIIFSDHYMTEVIRYGEEITKDEHYTHGIQNPIAFRKTDTPAMLN